MRRYLSANAIRRAVSAFRCDRYDGLRSTGPERWQFCSAAPADGKATVEATRHQGRTRACSDGEGAARGVCSDGCATQRVRGWAVADWLRSDDIAAIYRR